MKNKVKAAVIAAALLATFVGNALNIKIGKKDEPMVDYNEWIPQQQWPENIDGAKQFYPITKAVAGADNEEVADTIAVVEGRLQIPGLDARQCFLAALVYASDNFDTEANEGFEEIDYNDLSFKMLLKTTQGRNNTETTYTRSIECSAADGGIGFVVTDIDCKFRDKGIIPRTLRLEKLQPGGNKRHSELVKEFVEVNSDYLNNMASYVSTRKDISSPNFDKLKRKADVAEGMNMDEVTILLGPPLNKRKSGTKYRWIYSNDFVVIFADGVVTKIVD